MSDSNDDNAAYYLARAEQEDEAASNAVNLLASKIHRTLASCYRARACEFDDRGELSAADDLGLPISDDGDSFRQIRQSPLA